jgi:hypothetical protein
MSRTSTVYRPETIQWATKKGRRKKKKSILQITFKLFNYTFNQQNLTSLTQLGVIATQNCDKIEHRTHAPILRTTENVSIFFEN